MTYKSFLKIIIVFFILGFANSLFAQNQFVGVKKCAMCHKAEKYGNQIKKWENGPHSHAIKTLQTAEADKVAMERGYTTKAVETPECLNCHAPQHTVDASLIKKSFDLADGVQCESCHNAGSKYKTMATMKNHEKAVEKGLREFKDDKAIEELCISCHNEKSPKYKEFNFKNKWEKIKHPIPVKK